MVNWLFRSLRARRRQAASPRRAGERRLKSRTFESLEQRRLLAAVSWVGGASGLWDKAANWSTGQVPGVGDDVDIGSGSMVTIQLGDAESIDSLSTDEGSTLVMSGGSLTVNSTSITSVLAGNFNLSGGTLEGASNLAFWATVSWTGGTMDTTGTTAIVSGGTLNISSRNNLSLGGTLTNNGTLSLGASLTVSGSFTEQAGATLVEQWGGTQSGQYGMLSVIGTAALAGTLEVNLSGGYSPGQDSAVVFLSASSVTGEFTSVENVTQGSEYSFSALYSPTGVALGVSVISLSPSSLPADTANSPYPYDQTITASGGTGPVTLAVSDVQGAIPGLSVPLLDTDSGTGRLSIGFLPTGAGTVTFTVTATDSLGAPPATANYSITVNPVGTAVPLTGANWMSYVSSGASLFQMSLPGTHDSMTGSGLIPGGTTYLDDLIDSGLNSWLGLEGYPALAGLLDGITNLGINGLDIGELSQPIVQLISQSQSADLATQLNEGIRALDIRVGLTDNSLEIVHGPVTIGNPPLMFDTAVLQVVTDFLAQHPSETVVMQVQQDYNDNTSVLTTAQVFQDYEAEVNPDTDLPYRDYIYDPTSSRNVNGIPPNLGAARGKIVIIQSNWTGSAPFPNSYSGEPQSPLPVGEDKVNTTNPEPDNRSVDIIDPIQNDFQEWDLNLKSSEAEQLIDWDAGTWDALTSIPVVNQNIPVVNESPPAENNPTTQIPEDTTFAVNYLSANASSFINIVGGWVANMFSSYYWFPYAMATGSGGEFSFNLGNLLEDAAIETGTVGLAGFTGNLEPVVEWSPEGTGVGMDSSVESYINSNDNSLINGNPAPLGIVFMDFPESQPGLIQDIYSHNPFPITLSPDGTLTLDANCEPAGSHTITIGTSSGGVQASVDGQSLLFAPGQVTSIDVIGGPGSNSVDVEGLPPGVSLSIQGVSSAIQGATGPNVVTIDDTSGFLSQCGSITFTGGVGGNTLILENGTFTNELETANGYQSGSIVFNNDQPIIFNNVATVDDTMSVTGTATFQSTGSNETTTAADGGVINGFNAIQLNIGGSPSFFVANKATITVAVSDAGADTVDINTPVAATGVGTLNVDMRGGSAAVTFDVLATSMVTNLYGDNTSDSFTVSSDAGIDNPPQG
ncbi:MAG: phosphatidylinositol-specific phospholipase C domain-containing protein, partial [Thermoguttaceae bacterium]